MPEKHLLAVVRRLLLAPSAGYSVNSGVKNGIRRQLYIFRGALHPSSTTGVRLEAVANMVKFDVSFETKCREQPVRKMMGDRHL